MKSHSPENRQAMPMPVSMPGWRYRLQTMQLLEDVWVFFPAIPFFIVAFRNAPNIPIMDDYDAILNFLNQWRGAGLPDRLSLLFLQHNEHRLLYSRIMYVLYYSITGNINFRNLILLADMQLTVVASVCIYFVRHCAGKYWRIIAFIWMVCLFDLSTYESASIAMYGMQNYGIIMLFFVSLYGYDRSNKWLPAAAILQAICIFSSGNGMIGAFFIAVYNLRSADKWKKIVSILTTVVCVPLYFVNYVSISQPDKLPFKMSTALIYFVRMTGALFNFDSSLYFGLFVIALVIAVLIIRPVKVPWSILCILGFVLGSMGASAIFRSCLKGAQFQTSRYLIYPELLLAIVSLLVWLKLETKKYRWVVMTLLLAGLLHVYSGNFYLGRMGFTRLAGRAIMLRYYYPDKKEARKITDESCQDDIYCLESERQKILLSAK